MKIVRIRPRQTEFKHDNCVFTVEPRPRKEMKIWTLRKRFRSISVKYRVLNDVKKAVPIAIQRLAS